MRPFLFLLLASLLGCGKFDDGAKDAPPEPEGGKGQACYGNPETCDTECVTRDITNAAASEKVNAAFCFGLGFDDTFSCTYNPTADETRCLGTTTAYVVVHMQTADDVTGAVIEDDFERVGDVYDLSDGAHMAIVYQLRTDAFSLELDSGQTGACVVNGDVATLCVAP
jgi:hypothetical protein